MSEEVQNASKEVPRAMISIYIANFCLLLPMILTACYHMPDTSKALNDKTAYPFIYILKESTSTGGVTVILVITMLLLLGSNITFLTATSRDMYAFARDQGLPFSGWLATVDKHRNVPVNASIATCTISFCLTLIYIGSPVAFYALTSLFTVTIMQCYCLSIACILWRRIYRPKTLPYAQFSLGKCGIPLNVIGVIYGIWGFFWCFWPQEYPVTASGFNWASPLFITALIGALAHYISIGRKRYTGPVALLEGRTGAAE